MLWISAQQDTGRLDGLQCGLCHQLQHSNILILGMQLGDCVPSGLVCREGALSIHRSIANLTKQKLYRSAHGRFSDIR